MEPSDGEDKGCGRSQTSDAVGAQGGWGSFGSSEFTGTSTTHEELNPRLFANKHRILAADGWTGIDPDAPLDEWLHRDVEEYGDLKVVRAEAEEWLASLAGADAGQAPAQSEAEGVVATSQPAQIEQRPQPTNPAVSAWLRARVERWRDDLPPPNAEVDFTAMKKHFAPDLARDDFLTLRNDVVPAAWRRQGKRRPWGELKEAAKLSPA